jgi:hypothetical protein
MWQWLFQFLEPLEAADIDYAIVGSVASSIYGEPRATNDIDLVIQLRTEDAGKLVRAFDENQFYVPPEEVIRVELARSAGAHLNVIALDDMTKADLYPLPVHQQLWFERRKKVEVAGRSIWLAAPEVVILHKLIFHRAGGGERHLRDIQAMQAASRATIDGAWLHEEAKKLGLEIPPG